MNPKIENYSEEDNILNFTLKGADVCFAHAIRRTLLSDIPTVVFKTMPYEENKCTIFENTSRLNNEILKGILNNIDNEILKKYFNIDDNKINIEVVEILHLKSENLVIKLSDFLLQ